MVALVVATTADAASIGPASALLSMPGWHPGPSLEEGGMASFANGVVRLLQHGKSIVAEDNLDLRWEEATGEKVEEVIFLSRHSAVARRPALTVHPIGVPHLREDEVPLQGGRPGWVGPPNPRMGSWIRLMKRIADAHNLTPEFEVFAGALLPILCTGNLRLLQIGEMVKEESESEMSAREYYPLVTLEATHHGPLVNTPTMFVEIGSTEEHWGRQDAAQVVALLLWEGLGLDGGSGLGRWDRVGKVLLGLGGGHYVPRHMDIVAKDGVWVGHMLSGYSLPMEDPGNDKKGNVSGIINGTWKNAIRVSFEATEAAFPGGQIIAHLDHKAFKGWQRNAIVSFLAEQNIRVGKPADFL